MAVTLGVADISTSTRGIGVGSRHVQQKEQKIGAAA
jgi:hypothetical protein